MKEIRLILFLATIKLISAIDVYPDFSSTDCIPSSRTDTPNNFTHAFRSVINRSNWSIILKEPGCYRLDEFHILEEVFNISIVGYGDNASNYSIHCSENVGLAFTQIKGLQVRNIVIDGCGMGSDNVASFSASVNQTIDMFFKVPKVIGYGVALSDCFNVELQNVIVKNTMGLGVLAINVVGKSEFNHLQLLNNWAPICYFTSLAEVGSQRSIGGGMYVLYQDYLKDKANMSNNELSMSNIYAYNNSYCQPLNLISTIYAGTRTARIIGHDIGSASGVGIALTQLKFAVDLTISSSTFKNNTGWTSSGAAITVFSGVSESRITLDNCSFIKNGFNDYSYRPFGVITANAGLLVIMNAQNPYEKLSSLLALSNYSTLVVKNSLFKENSAEVCANVEVIMFDIHPFARNYTKHRQVVISNTTMTGNQGTIGPVFCASNKNKVAEFSEISVEFIDLYVVENKVHSPNGNVQYNLIDSSGQMVLLSVNVLFTGSTVFTGNEGVAIIGVSSNLYFSDSVEFHSNSGNFGGALQLLQQSHIVLLNNTALQFIENTARFKGGAVFNLPYSDFATASNFDCFFYFQYIDIACNFTSCPCIGELNISVAFENNSAPFGGTIYGSTLSNCPWYYDLGNVNHTCDHQPINITNSTGLQTLSILYPDKFYFCPSIIDNSSAKVISTDAAWLTAEPYVADNERLVLSFYPGETLRYRVKAFDSFGYQTNALLLSASDNPAVANSTLGGDAVYWFAHSSDKNGTVTPVDIVGKENNSTSIDIFASTSSAITTIKIDLQICGVGFHYDDLSKRCVCRESTLKHVICNIENQTLTVNENHWFGPIPALNNYTVYSPCFYDLCRPGTKTFKPCEVDYQCKDGYNRTGLLCGQCVNNTGTIFGSNKCRECRNWTLFWIPAFAVAGILIIIFISFFDISVADGYICGFILYCNCLNYFIPYLTESSTTYYAFVLISWVNLELGLESCFYAGMSELARVGLRLIFPAYLYFLMFMIIFLARYTKFFAKFRFSAGKTFATLFTLSYFSLLGTSVHLLGVTRLQVMNDTDGDYLSYYGWLGDVSHPYGAGTHGFLVALAALLMIAYVLPIPTLLLFPPVFYKFRYSYKLKPILDAFWNPYRPSRRFWFGAIALFRIIPFTFGMYIRYPLNVFWFGIILCMFLFVQERLHPFHGALINGLDSFFIVNLIMLFFSNIYYEHYIEETPGAKTQSIGLVYIFILSAYVAFGLILIIHLLKRFPVLKTAARKFWFLMKGRKRQPSLELYSSSDDDDDGNYDRVNNSANNSRSVINFTEYREPLLDGVINTTSYESNKS